MAITSTRGLTLTEFLICPPSTLGLTCLKTLRETWSSVVATKISSIVWVTAVVIYELSALASAAWIIPTSKSTKASSVLQLISRHL